MTIVNCQLSIVELVISAYEAIAFYSVQYSLKLTRILRTAFISYAISNTTGFTLLIGGGIRYRFYNRHRVPSTIIAQILAFSNLSFWLGLLGVGGITFIFEPLAVPELIHLHFVTVRPIGIIFLILLSIYLYFSWQQKYLEIKGKKIKIPSLSISLSQIIISGLDWAIAAMTLYVLLPTHIHLSYLSFLAIYLLGITAAVISHVPGGLGVFDTVVLYLLPQQVTANDVLGSLLAYRIIYFLLPLVVALIWLGIYEVMTND